MTNELVRHFLIETSAKGVRLKGCPNEPYFGEFIAPSCRSAFHSISKGCYITERLLCVCRLSFCSGVPTLDDSAGSALQADDPHQRSASRANRRMLKGHFFVVICAAKLFSDIVVLSCFSLVYFVTHRPKRRGAGTCHTY